MGTRTALCLGILSSLILAGCTQDGGPNPLQPDSFADQFRHELRFNKVGAGGQGGVIQGNESDVVMLAFRASVDSPAEPVWIDSIVFVSRGTGNESTAVDNVAIYRDRNASGTLDSGEKLLDSGTFKNDDGRIRFNGFNQAIDHGEVKHYVVVYDFNGTANAGDTFRLVLADKDDVTSDGKDSGCPVTIRNLPTKGAEVVVGDTTTPQDELVVSLGENTPAARQVGPSDVGVELTQIKLELVSSNAIEVRSVRITASGDGDDLLDVDKVWLYHDVDGDGLVGASDSPLALSAVYDADNGVVTFPLGANLVLGPGVPQYILVVYDLNGNAWIDETFRAGIESSIDIAAFSGTTGAAAVVTGAPVDGNDIKVKFGE